MGTAMEQSFRERLLVPTIADGPKPAEIQLCLDGMQIVSKDADADFVDSLGRFVRFPRRDPLDPQAAPILGLPYGRVLWELKQGNILLGEDSKTVFRRDRDDTGMNSLLASFHAIKSVEQGFGIDAKKMIPGFDRLVRVMLNTQTNVRVRHGIKYSNLAFWRDRRTGAIDAPVIRLRPGDEVFDDPFELQFSVPFDDALVKQARAFIDFVAADPHSADNLARMFATPLLEPYKLLSYLLYGQGGNGKGTLGDALRHDPVTAPLTTSVDAKKLLGGDRGSGFSQEQQLNVIVGKLWAIDTDAEEVRLDQMTSLKKMSTGDPQYARRVQQDSVEVSARCTLILLTNNAVIMPDTEALRRRQVSVRFKDGRKKQDFLPLRMFIHEHGVAPFMMLSCNIWADCGDDVWTDVEIGDAATCSDYELWIIDRIVENGFAINGDNPNKVTNAERKNSLAKLGLVSKQKKIDGVNTRILAVGNEQRFKPFRTASEKAARDAEADAQATAQAEAEAKANILRAFLASQAPASENRIAEALAVSNSEVKTLLDPMLLSGEVVSSRGGYALA